jgi:hypothetical protein
MRKLRAVELYAPKPFKPRVSLWPTSPNELRLLGPRSTPPTTAADTTSSILDTIGPRYLTELRFPHQATRLENV